MADWTKQLEQDLSWREAELATLKLLVSESTPGSVRRTSLLRALWVMLYAHYEGFFKFAWDLYLGELERLGLQRDKSIATLARFSLAKNFRNLRKDLSATSLWECFTAHFDAWMKEQLQFEVRLETESNLWPNLAIENSTEVGLSATKVAAYEIELRALVSRRNDIAHGKNMVVQSLAEYQKYEDAATLAMHELAISVLETLENKHYLRP